MITFCINKNNLVLVYNNVSIVFPQFSYMILQIAAFVLWLVIQLKTNEKQTTPKKITPLVLVHNIIQGMIRIF